MFGMCFETECEWKNVFLLVGGESDICCLGTVACMSTLLAWTSTQLSDILRHSD